MNEKYVLVTGANGFIGSSLSCSLVEKGYTVLGIYRRPNSANTIFNKYVEEKKIIRFGGDISSFDYSVLPKNIEYVFHVAGRVSVWGKLEDFIKINYDSTVKLLEFCNNIKPKCFVYFSSTAVYGFNGYKNLSEYAIKQPFNNPYSLSKLKTETYVSEYCKQNALDFAIVRPGNVYGEYDYTSSHEIYSRIKKQKMLICARGKFKSCFVYVKNLTDAAIHIAEKKSAHNEDYNVTDGTHETLFEYFSQVASCFGVKNKFINFPAWMSKSMACVVEGFYKLFSIKKAPLITRFSVYQNCTDYDFCIDKLLATGFKAKYNTKDAIKNTCDWFNSIK